MICVLFRLPFRRLFREAFAMRVFSFAASMCMKYAFASFRGSSWKESPGFPSIHILKLLFLNSSSCCFPALSRLGPQPRALDLMMGTAGPQPRAPDFSSQLQAAAKNLNGQCRTPTAIARSQWAQQTTQAQDLSWHCNSLIKFLGRGPSQLVTAFADLSRSFRETFADFRARSREIW